MTAKKDLEDVDDILNDLLGDDDEPYGQNERLKQTEIKSSDEDFYSNLASIAVKSQNDNLSDSGGQIKNEDIDDLDDDLFKNLGKSKFKFGSRFSSGNEVSEIIKQDHKADNQFRDNSVKKKVNTLDSPSKNLNLNASKLDAGASFENFLQKEYSESRLGHDTIRSNNQAETLATRRQSINSPLTDNLSSAANKTNQAVNNARNTTRKGLQDDWLGLFNDEPTRDKQDNFENAISSQNVEINQSARKTSRRHRDVEQQQQSFKSELFSSSPDKIYETKQPNSITDSIQNSLDYVPFLRKASGNDSTERKSNVKVEDKLSNSNVNITISKDNDDQLKKIHQTDISELQIKISTLQVERDHLKGTLTILQNNHDDELKALEISYKKQSELMEESHKRTEARLQHDVEGLEKEIKRRQHEWEEERTEIILSWQKKMKSAEATFSQEIENLRESHRQNMTDVKREQEEISLKLQRSLLDQSQSALPYATMFKDLLQQFGNVKSEFGKIISEEKTGKMTHEVQASKQQKDEEEKQKFEQRIAVEIENLKMKAERNKLDMEREIFEKEKQIIMNNLEKEKFNLQAKISETIQIGSHKVKQQIDQSNSDHNLHSSLVEAELLGITQSIIEERKDLDQRAESIKLESERLLTDSLTLEKKIRELEEERSRLETWAKHLRQIAIETECTRKESTMRYEEGMAALEAAKQLWEEFTKQSDNLKSKSVRLAEEEVNLNKQKEQLAIRMNSLASKCMSQKPELNFEIQNSFMKINDLKWNLEAQTDRDFLQQEGRFLSSLKSPFHQN